MVLSAEGRREKAWHVSSDAGNSALQPLPLTSATFPQDNAECDQGAWPTCWQLRQPDKRLSQAMLEYGAPHAHNALQGNDSDAAIMQVRGTFLELATSEAELPLSQRFRRSWSDSDLHASADAAGDFVMSGRLRNDTDSTGDIGNTEALSSPGSWASAAGDQGASVEEAESEDDVIDLTTVETSPQVNMNQHVETKWNLNAAEWRPAEVPAAAMLAVEPAAAPAAERTTLVLRRLPVRWLAGGRASILEALDALGFEGLYDFMYAPADIQDLQSKGYAFVNFLTMEAAEEAMPLLRALEEAPTVGWSDLQGLARHIARYRDSPIMHKSVPEEIQPVLFKDGQRMPFPSPQGQVRRPCLSRRKPRVDDMHPTSPYSQR